MTPTAANAPSAPRNEQSLPAPSRTRRRWLLAVAGIIFVPAVLAAMWPVTFDSPEVVFDIPKGTWARRMAGDRRENLPSKIYLLTGIRNVLMFKNSDEVPQTFGPTLLMPGQSLRIPFTRPSENFFACTAHSNGQLVIVVEAEPAWPWSRLSWRVRNVVRRLTE